MYGSNIDDGESCPHGKARNANKKAPSRRQLHRAMKRSRHTATVADLTDPAVLDAVQRELRSRSVQSTTLPAVPIDTPRVTLEDDEETTQLLLNLVLCDSSAGSSGWSGGILLGLVKHTTCRTGIIALLSDMLNGRITNESRPYLLANLLLALNESSGTLRLVCVPELFYRMAAKIAVKRVRATVAALLQRHQYSLGVPGGREQLVRSIQQALTIPVPGCNVALLKVVISKAFDNCDRAVMLSKLYATAELGQLYHMAELAYSTPAGLLLHKCPDHWIQSCNGLRYGDPLSSLLLSLHLHHIYTSLARVTKATLYVFTEMVHIQGSPRDVMTAFCELQKLLAKSALECDQTQSQFVYFHQDSAPLDKTVTDQPAQHGIPISQDSAQVMGAIIASDEQLVCDGAALANSVALEVCRPTATSTPTSPCILYATAPLSLALLFNSPRSQLTPWRPCLTSTTTSSSSACNTSRAPTTTRHAYRTSASCPTFARARSCCLTSSSSAAPRWTSMSARTAAPSAW